MVNESLQNKNIKECNEFLDSSTNMKYTNVKIYKSLRHIYIQLIDTFNNSVKFSLSSISKIMKKKYIFENKKIMSEFVGNEFAKFVKSNNIYRISFNRNKKKYHGRIKSIADKIRLSGIKI